MQKDNDSFTGPTESPHTGKRGLILFIILLVGLVFIFRSSGGGPGIIWIEGLDEGILRAQQENKPILLAFHASWCPPCRDMKRSTYKSPEVISLVEEYYVPILMDVDRDKQIAAKYNVSPIPVYFLCSPDGTPNSSFVGYFDAEEFLAKISFKEGS